MSSSPQIKKGDIVRFSRQWLRNTGNIVGDVPLHEGVVVGLGELSQGRQVVLVEDAAFGEWKALDANLVKRGPDKRWPREAD